MLKKFGLGILGLIVLFGIIGALSGGNKAKTDTSPVVAAPTAQAAATVAPVAAVNTPTVAPKPTTPPAPTATAQPTKAPVQTIAKVGQRVESGGIALTVNAVSKAASLGQFFKAKEGNTYLIADVTIENVGRDKAPYNPLYFKVKDGDGYEYNAGLMIDDKALKSGELAAGEKARGTVSFEVPTMAKGLVSSYQPLVIFGGYQVIRVALE